MAVIIQGKSLHPVKPHFLRLSANLEKRPLKPPIYRYLQTLVVWVIRDAYKFSSDRNYNCGLYHTEKYGNN